MSSGHHGDGDGWVECACGQRHWGRFGAAGLLVHAVGPRNSDQVLLQHRVSWSHDGNTWGVPGGARDSTEDALEAALREAAEETGLAPDSVRPTAQLVVDHGPWSYTTVLADAVQPISVTPLAESAELAWVPLDEVESRVLHSGFAQSWRRLREAVGLGLQVIVDGANVVGSRPDGWWRDRAGAAARLRDSLGQGFPRPVDAARLPDESGLPSGFVWYAEVTMVVEGAAISVAGTVSSTRRSTVADSVTSTAAGRRDPADWLQVVGAKGSGDDTIVDEVRASVAAGRKVLVVTADRALKQRVRLAGGSAVGPSWLLRLLEEPH